MKVENMEKVRKQKVFKFFNFLISCRIRCCSRQENYLHISCPVKTPLQSVLSCRLLLKIIFFFTDEILDQIMQWKTSNNVITKEWFVIFKNKRKYHLQPTISTGYWPFNYRDHWVKSLQIVISVRSSITRYGISNW